MVRRLALVLAICLFFAGSSAVGAKGSGSKGSSRGTARTGHKAASGKTVHVKEYTRKDGTKVEAHDRKAPEPKTGESHPSVVPAPIRVITDPVTGRKTFTNEPIAPLAATRLPLASSITPATAAHRAAILSATGTGPHASRSVTVGRSAAGRVARSEAAKRRFEIQTGYPHGRPGYVVDHIKPLACGGSDMPSNMQWQTIAAAKAKDKIERIGCR